MRADIINNKFVTMGLNGKYEVLNPSNLLYDMTSIIEVDSNNNKKYVPANIDEENKTCEIIINPLYQEEYGE